MDFIVGESNGVAHAILDRSGFALQTRTNDREGGLGRLLAGGLAANAVDNKEDTACGVAMKAIFVAGALQTRVAVAGGFEHRADLHGRGHSASATATHVSAIASASSRPRM